MAAWRDLAERRQREAVAARAATTTMYQLAERERATADRQRLEAQRRAYVAHLRLADQAIESSDSAEALRLLALTEPPLRGWEFRHLFQKADSS